MHKGIISLYFGLYFLYFLTYGLAICLTLAHRRIVDVMQTRV